MFLFSFTFEFLSHLCKSKRKFHDDINRFAKGQIRYSVLLLVSLWPFGWNEWAVYLLGLFDLSWDSMSFVFSHFLASKIKEFLTSLFFFLNFYCFWVLSLVPFLLQNIWYCEKASALLICFDYTCEIIELFQVLSPYAWEMDVVHHSAMPYPKRTPDTDLEAVKATEWCLCKEPLTAFKASG